MSLLKKNTPSPHLVVLNICRKFSQIIITLAFLPTNVLSQFGPDLIDPFRGSGQDIDLDSIQKMEEIDKMGRGRDVLGLNVCGTIYTAAGHQVTFKEDESLSQQQFEMIHIKKLKNALFQPNAERNCVIQVCGYTSYGKREYIGSDDDYAGCLMVESNSAARKVKFLNDAYNLSSINCGCNYHHKKNCTNTCNTESVNYTRTWSKNECTRLFQEKECNTCYFDDIQLSDGQNYTTDNSEHVLSMVVKDNCEVHFRSPALKSFYKFYGVPQPIIYKSGPTTEVVSAFQSEPEYFYCVCDHDPRPTPPPSPTSTPYPVTKPPHENGVSGTIGYVIGGVGVFSFVVLIFTGIVVSKQVKTYYSGFRSVNNESQENIMHNAETSNEEEPEVVNVDENTPVADAITRSVPLHMGFETFRELFEVQEVIGQGHFGQVSLGALKVAIKTVKADISSSDRETCIKSLEQEIKILSHLGSHPNVVRFHNAYIGDCINGDIFLILELCQGGSLESHLRGTVARRIQEILCNRHLEIMRCVRTVNDYPEDMPNVDFALPNHENGNNNDLENLDPGLLRQFYKWCSEIVCGMIHIQSKNIDHLDLATRNVLLTSNLVAKIADFGLSKKVYVRNYESNGINCLPVRWVAPELLTIKKCSSKSDVWSFGVTAWEIFNLGKVPYEDLDIAQVVASIIIGGRLECPQYATADLYSKLMECWNECPDERPSFENLQNYFDCKIQEVPKPI